MAYIYKITNSTNGKVYIGKTEAVKSNRLSQHKSDLKHNRHVNKHLQSAWNKYGEESFVFEVVEKFDHDLNFDINNLERYWIAKFESNNPEKGYNKTEGGEGILNPSKEIRLKMSNAKKGKSLSQNHRQKISKANSGKPVSEEQKRYLSEIKKGKPFSGPRLIGKDHPNFGKPSVRRKPVVCLTNGKSYESAHDAAVELDCYSTNIQAVCRGVRSHTKGYKFEYLKNQLEQTMKPASPLQTGHNQ